MDRSDIYKQNQRLGRGVNIIGYDPLWKSMPKARMQNKQFRLIKEAGFDSVRIPLHPFRDNGIDEENKITDKWFKTLDWAVEQSLSNELMVIIDFHEFGAMGQEPMGNKERFLATWEQMAERYKNHPNEVVFEILNEPNKELTPELWNQFHSEAFAIIRETNPTRTVIIGPGHWNSINYLDQLELPENDRNIIATVHYYSPMEFTHQGAGWAGYKDKTGIEWKATDDEKQAIAKDLQKAQIWAEKYDRPLFLGEFGAYDKADMDSRVRYINFITRLAEEMGWSWAYWQFDSDFILYDIPGDRWIEPLRDALIPH
jgi:endoglucanase